MAVDAGYCSCRLLLSCMKLLCIRLLVVCFLLVSGVALAVVPLPNQMKTLEGFFVFSNKTVWVANTPQQVALCSKMINRFEQVAGFEMKLKSKATGSSLVVLKTKSGLPPEGYELNVSPRLIEISASSDAGFFYAFETLRQLLPPSFEGNGHVDEKWQVPCVAIKDEPRFGYRGFMLDVARYFLPKDDLLQLIDRLAMHKINVLHLHLVDDNGWRIEIKKYPKLTDVGAWRANRENYFSMRSNPIGGEPTTNGGYYTQGDIREIVAYAQDRFIEVIPEIEMPAHTNSSLAAYPHLTCPVVDTPIGVLPGIGGAHASVIYCAGNDQVFHFLQDVIDEVVDLFPSRYFHVGGDEANKENWKKCPLCQHRIKDNQLKDEEALQSYFLKRINSYLKTKNRIMMGWDEVADSEIPDDAIIMGWRGDGHAALIAADQGHPIIMTPARKLYLIRYQGPQWFEPFTYFGNNTLQDVYVYDPLRSMTPAQGKLLMGVQASLWSEFVRSYADVEYLVFPRLAAMAEMAWTNPSPQSWPNFLTRLDGLALRYQHIGINYATSMFNLDHRVFAQDGQMKVELGCIRPDVAIRYTLDGSEPKASSPIYGAPIALKQGDCVRAASFMAGQRQGAILPLNILWHKGIGATVFGDTQGLLTNGVLGSEKMSDGEYLDYYNSDASLVLKLAEATSLQRLVLHSLNNYGMAVHAPSAIRISVSADGVNYHPLETRLFSETERFSKGFYKDRFVFEFNPQKIQYIKVEMTGPGLCPVGDVREGQPARMVFDELELF